MLHPLYSRGTPIDIRPAKDGAINRVNS
jgi:hypothetical protein